MVRAVRSAARWATGGKFQGIPDLSYRCCPCARGGCRSCGVCADRQAEPSRCCLASSFPTIDSRRTRSWWRCFWLLSSGEPGYPGLVRAVDELPPDVPLSRWQLRRWLSLAVCSLRRAHGILGQGRDLFHLRSGTTVVEPLAEVVAYVSVFQVRDRGPPGARAVGRLLRHHHQMPRSCSKSRVPHEEQ